LFRDWYVNFSNPNLALAIEQQPVFKFINLHDLEFVDPNRGSDSLTNDQREKVEKFQQRLNIPAQKSQILS
jgi:hypothetical protein